MSRFKRLWVLVVPATFALLLGGMPPAMAWDWPPPPPSAADRCGTRLDQYYVPPADVVYTDGAGNFLPQGVWLSTGGAASVTVIAKDYSDPDVPFTLAFGTEPDASCTEALDTVTTRVVSCNTRNNGTRVEFTYANVDDASDRWHTNPYVEAVRWDKVQTAQVWPAFGRVDDGMSALVTGGDADSVGRANEFYLSPGTYNLTLRTDETGSRVLPNRLFVPACGTSTPPAGDPMGGPTPQPPKVSRPTASIGSCRAHRVRVVMDARKATRLTQYRLVVDPKRGKTRRATYNVGAGLAKVVVLKKQRRGTLVKVMFAGKTVQRRLRC